MSPESRAMPPSGRLSLLITSSERPGGSGILFSSTTFAGLFRLFF
jgi:hypothetical protein